MAYVPYAPELGCKYRLVSDQATAVFNDPLDPDYVGVLNDVTGLDGAEVRESAEDLTESDGGSHGNFYFSRRAITMSGLVYGHASKQERTIKVDKLMRASLAMRGDAILYWWPDGSSIPMQTWVRRQAKPSVTGGWNKDFQLALVSEYAPLFSQAVLVATAASATNFTIENQGSFPAFPILRIENASTSPTVSNFTADPDQKLFTTGLTLVSGEAVEIDTLNHIAVFAAGPRAGQSANRYIDFGATNRWPSLLSGTNAFRLDGGGNLTVRWRHTWA